MQRFSAQRCGRVAALVALTLLLSLCALAAGAQTLASYWRGDGNAVDSVTGLPGTIYGTVTFPSAVVNQGFDIQGSGSGVGIADATRYQIAGSLTIQAWVKVTSTPFVGQVYSQIFMRGINVPNNAGGYTMIPAYSLAVDYTSSLVFQINGPLGTAVTRAPIAVGRFYYVQAVLDATKGTISIYLNGSRASQATTSVVPVGSFSTVTGGTDPGLAIGNTQVGAAQGQPFNGIVDELQLWSGALPPAQPVKDLLGTGHPSALVYEDATGGLGYWGFNGVALTAAGSLTSTFNPIMPPVGLADLLGTGQPGILFRNIENGAVTFTQLNNLNAVNTYTVATSSPTDLRYVGSADLFNVGQPELIWQSQSTGVVYYTVMSGYIPLATYVFPQSPGTPNWVLSGLPDLNGDGHPDFLWYNRVSGAVAYWIMDGTNESSYGWIVYSTPGNWEIVGTPDLNEDGVPDILWHNTASGALAYWLLTPNTYGIAQEGYFLDGYSTSWEPVSK